jgi:post-segregation antitoxin (ccd killing protein)
VGRLFALVSHGFSRIAASSLTAKRIQVPTPLVMGAKKSEVGMKAATMQGVISAQTWIISAESWTNGNGKGVSATRRAWLKYVFMSVTT